MVNKELMTRLLKNSTIDTTDVLSKSKVFSQRELMPTPVPMMNVALSGSLDGGLAPGMLLLAAESKRFKTGFGLLLMSSFLEKYQDGVVLFYDSEFGAPESYFSSFNVDKSRVIHSPITNVEELRHDIAKQLKEIQRDDKVFIFIDSIGNLASLKEVNDAEQGNSAADMTRAKQLKSLFRIVTPHLTLKHIPMVVVNHVYKEMAMYPKDIVSGGSGPYLSANDIWIIGRAQEKDATTKEVYGYDFKIKIEKSRFVKEGSIIPVYVDFNEGIYKWSGLFDEAVDAGFIIKEGKSYLTKGAKKEVSRKTLENDEEFWASLVKDPNFNHFIERKYQLVKKQSDSNSNIKESNSK